MSDMSVFNVGLVIGLLVGLVIGTGLGTTINNDYKVVQEHMLLANELCEKYQGPESIDFSDFDTADVICNNGMTVKFKYK
jgi:hypothetical protein